MPISKQLRVNLSKTEANYFDMTGSDIRKEDIIELCELLAKKPNIAHIILEQNQLLDKGAILLAKHLPSHISSINLTRTDIGDIGVEALLKNRNITKLVLAKNNAITKNIANLFNGINHVIEIDLTGIRGLTEDTAKTIQEKIKTSETNLVTTSPNLESTDNPQLEKIFSSPLSTSIGTESLKIDPPSQRSLLSIK